jgi:mono/diheme cytochrome c family protein
VIHARDRFARLALALGLAVAVALGGCGQGGPGETVGVHESNLPCAESATDGIRLGLEPHCVGCHGPGSSRPFFASLRAFEDLIAYDTRYVVRGDPDASVLVSLLEGTATGAYPQMPLAGDAFAVLASSGATTIGMDEIRAWIRDLPPPPASRVGASADAANIRRLSTEEIIRAMQVALDQEPTGGVPPLLQLDGVAPLAPDSPRYVDYQDGGRIQTYLMLGGASYLTQRPPEPDWSPSSLLALTQIAQGACSRAVDVNSAAIFEHTTATARLPAAEADVRANIAYLYRRFLHVPPTDAELEVIFDEVYAPAEATSPRSAWVQVCTTLMRDPLFITF